MNKILFIALISFLVGCRENKSNTEKEKDTSSEVDSKVKIQKPLQLSLEQANVLSELPLVCMQTEYPNKLGQVLGNKENLGEPHQLHPAFYGCFDWHSAVHGHWSLVKLLKEYPKLDKSAIIKSKLTQNISKEK